MTQDLFAELRKIRNEMAHGKPSRDTAVRRLAALSTQVSATELVPAVLKILEFDAATYYVPNLLLPVVGKILEGRQANLICDPWAGVGALLAPAYEAIHPKEALAFSQGETEAQIGRILAKFAKWQVGDPLDLINPLKNEIDVAVSVLPFGLKTDRKILSRPLLSAWFPHVLIEHAHHFLLR